MKFKVIIDRFSSYFLLIQYIALIQYCNNNYNNLGSWANGQAHLTDPNG